MKLHKKVLKNAKVEIPKKKNRTSQSRLFKTEKTDSAHSKIERP